MDAVVASSIIGAILSVVIGKHIYDWYHETDKRNKMMEAQMRLLAQIAVAQGVNTEKIEEILLDSGYKGKAKK